MTPADRFGLSVGPRHQQSPVRRRRHRLLILGLKGFTVVLALLVLTVGVAWPLTPSVADAEHRIRVRLAQHQAAELIELPTDDKVAVAVLATEDSRFRSHWGIDVVGVARAALHAADSSQDAGGATLDQQLAKNLWTGDGGPVVKAEQVELSLKLEASYRKEQILRMYLAEVYFGHGFYGLLAAARGYFGRQPATLSWAQASLLAGLVQAPSAYDPYRHLSLAKRRQQHVLNRLVAVHALTSAAARTEYDRPLGLS